MLLARKSNMITLSILCDVYFLHAPHSSWIWFGFIMKVDGTANVFELLILISNLKRPVYSN